MTAKKMSPEQQDEMCRQAYEYAWNLAAKLVREKLVTEKRYLPQFVEPEKT